MRWSIPAIPLLLGLLLAAGVPSWAQSPNDPFVPPLPPPPPPKAPSDSGDREEQEREQGHGAPTYLPDDDGPWGLPDEMMARLADRANAYRDYAKKFICLETVRDAQYGGSGEADKETSRRFEYLLDWSGQGLQELRAKVKRDGTVAGNEIEEEAGFPPAYTWGFLFSDFYQNYFEYREIGTPHFEGFDYVRAIQFKGALPWAGGKDIREWEGVAIVDGTTLTPLEIRAEPTGQADRLRAAFDRWARSFSIIGLRTAPKPLGYQCRVEFGLRKDQLNLPTALRYDTFRVVGLKQTRPTRASIRQYDRYEFFGTKTDTETYQSSTGSSSEP